MLEVRFDETHFEMKVPRELHAQDAALYECGHFPLVMVKATMAWWYGGDFPEESSELYVPPAALSESCTAESLWAALRQSLPVNWDEMARHCKILFLLLSHDSHKGNLRLVRGICEAVAPNVVVLSSRCCMHQLQLVLCRSYTHRAISYHNELFCLCKLLHHGAYMRKSRSRMHSILEDRFRVVYTPADPTNLAWARTLLDLMFVIPVPEDDDDDEAGADQTLQTSSLQRRVAASRAFRKIFNGRWIDVAGRIHHHCNMNCECLHERDSRERAHEQLDAFILRICQRKRR